MIILGIDPGASGAIAVIEHGIADFQAKWLDPSPQFYRFSETEKDVSDWLSYFASADTEKFAFIEQVHSMPKQGVASSFKFGMSYGFVRGLITAYGIPFETVTPGKWQKAMGCLTKGDKNVSKAAAQRLFPGVKVIHANADALLIAEYGRRVTCGRRMEADATP